MFKSLIAAKTRNVIIFGFHPSAQKCSVEAARIVRDAAVAAGVKAENDFRSVKKGDMTGGVPAQITYTIK